MSYHPIQRPIKPVLLGHLRVAVQKGLHRRLPKPLFVDEQLAARRNQPIDGQ